MGPRLGYAPGPGARRAEVTDGDRIRTENGQLEPWWGPGEAGHWGQRPREVTDAEAWNQASGLAGHRLYPLPERGLSFPV